MINYGKILKLKFDGPVYNVSDADIGAAYLVGGYGDPTFEAAFYPEHIGYGNDTTEILLHFDNINQLKFPVRLIFSGVKMGSQDLPFSDTAIEIFPQGLKPIPSNEEFVSVQGAELSGFFYSSSLVKAYNNPDETYPSPIAGYFGAALYQIQYLNAYKPADETYPAPTDGYFTGIRANTSGVPI